MIEASPPVDELSLSRSFLAVLLVTYCALDRVLASHFASDDWGETKSPAVFVGGDGVGEPHEKRVRDSGGRGGGTLTRTTSPTAFGMSHAGGHRTHDPDSMGRDVLIFTGALFAGATVVSVLQAMCTPSLNRARLFETAAYINAVAAYAHLTTVLGGDWFLAVGGGEGCSQTSGTREDREWDKEKEIARVAPVTRTRLSH